MIINHKKENILDLEITKEIIKNLEILHLKELEGFLNIQMFHLIFLRKIMEVIIVHSLDNKHKKIYKDYMTLFTKILG
jgi:hypothetical protein